MGLNEKNNYSNSSFWMKQFPFLTTYFFLVAGYVVGFKFIQLGIPDLGLNKIGMSEREVNLSMGMMAIVTALSAIIFGVILSKKKIGLKKKIYLMLILIGLEGGAQISLVSSVSKNSFWFSLFLFSLILGGNFPLVFSMLYYFVPRRFRGWMAGLITGTAYLLGNLSPFPWTATGLMTEAAVLMIPGATLLAILIFKKGILKDLEMKTQENSWKAEHLGRYLIREQDSLDIFSILNEKNLLLFSTIFIFGVYFVDSFAFLRIIHDPEIISQTWRGPLTVRASFGIIHFISAILVGYLYQTKGIKPVLFLSFVGFGIVDILYSFYPSGSSLIAVSLLYCSVVSTYTIANFGIWADISDENSLSKNIGIGLGVGGWLSSFLSTMITSELFIILPGINGFQIHLLIVAGVSAIFFLFLLFLPKLNERLDGNEKKG